MSQFSLKPDQKDGGKDEKTAWTIVYAIFALITVVLFVEKIANHGVSLAEAAGFVLYLAGLAWCTPFASKFHFARAGRNVAVGVGLLLASMVLTFLV